MIPLTTLIELLDRVPPRYRPLVPWPPSPACGSASFILGASRLDFGRMCDDDDSVQVLTGQGETHLRDALIGATALVDDCILVTYDARLASRARERGVEVLTTNELLTEFGFQPVNIRSTPRTLSSYADTSNSPPSV